MTEEAESEWELEEREGYHKAGMGMGVDTTAKSKRHFQFLSSQLLCDSRS